MHIVFFMSYDAISMLCLFLCWLLFSTSLYELEGSTDFGGADALYFYPDVPLLFLFRFRRNLVTLLVLMSGHVR